MKKILFIFGTRPEAIKMAPVIKEMEKNQHLKPVVCVTAQHREMLDQVLGIFSIEPQYDLNIMEKDQTLFDITSNVLLELKTIIDEVKPDMIVVQGDTTTTFVSALAGYYNQIPIAHVEAGLRSFNKYSPFPEEMNRVFTSHVADLHFAPTEWARQNLLKEGIPDSMIRVTGNPVIDALHYIVKIPPTEEVLRLIEQVGLHRNPDEPGPRLILVTAHRRENFGQPLENICAALRALAESYGQDLRIVYAVHLNPNVQEPVYRNLQGISNIALLPPLDYQPLVHLMKRAAIVLTDSGGLQEEAPDLGIPVLVMREVTERPEGVEAGTVKLVGTDSDIIIQDSVHSVVAYDI